MSEHSTVHDSDIAVKEKLKEPSQYNVIVHNNDHTTYEEVIMILSQAFEMSSAEALEVAKKVDTVGKGICGTYSKEIAEMKLLLVEVIKEQMVALMPLRQVEIMMLKFTIEKV